MVREKEPNRIKIAIQSFKEASECLKYDKKANKFAFELEDSNYNNPKVDMSTFREKLAVGLARLGDIINIECYDYHMPKDIQEDLFNRLRFCVNLIVDDEEVKKALLNGASDFDYNSIRACDLEVDVDDFRALQKIYHTRIENIFRHLDKFDETSVKRIKREVIKRFKRECVSRLENLLYDKSNGRTFEERIRATMHILRADFVGLYDDGDTQVGTVEMVNDPSLDIDVSKVPLELVNNFEEDESKEGTVETKGSAEQIKTETVETEVERKTVQLSKW